MATHTFNLAANFSVLAYTQKSGNTVMLLGDLTGSGTATENDYYPGSPGANAFANDNATTAWATNVSGMPDWVTYEFASAKIVNKLRIFGYGNSAKCPTAWTFQGSNNGTDWTDIDTQSGQTDTYENSWHDYTFTNTTAYLYYRFYVTATVGGLTQVGELEYLNTTGTFLIHDSGQNYCDAGSGRAFDNSTAAHTTDFTTLYQYADYDADQSFADAAAVDSGASWNGSWLTLAQLQAVDNTGKRYRYLKCQIDGGVADDFSSFSIDDYVVDTTPPALPTLTRFAQFGVGSATHACLVWTEPADADFEHCWLKKVVDGTTYYLNNVDDLPVWQESEGTYFTFADGDNTKDCCASFYVDEDITGSLIQYYIKAVDEHDNDSAWQVFTASAVGGIIPCAMSLSL